MRFDYKSRLNNLSPASKAKYIRLVDHLIEIHESSPSAEDINFFPIYGEGFTIMQQHSMLTVLCKWRIMNELERNYKYRVSLNTLKEFRKILDQAEHQITPTREPTTVTDVQIPWPEDFIWEDDNTFKLGSNGKLSFSSAINNNRRTYFRMMTVAKTWVKVSKMAEATGEDAEHVRVKVNQVKYKIHSQGFGKLITIEPKRDYSGGAYRLVPYPN